MDAQTSKTRWFQSHWFKAVELLALVIGVGAISYEIWQRETVDRPLARATLEEFTAAQEARLRQYLAEPHVPFPAKAIAFQQLLTMGVSVDGLSLGCTDLYGAASTENRAQRDCHTAQDRPVELSLSQQGRPRYINLGLDGLYLQNSQFDDVHCFMCDLHYTLVSGGTFTGARFENSNLSGMVFDPTVAEGLELNGSHVTGTRFRDWHIDTISFHGAWFWEDDPPLFESEQGYLVGLAGGGGALELAIDLGMVACDPTNGGPVEENIHPLAINCPFYDRATYDGLFE
jgi:hypothetical protein